MERSFDIFRMGANGVDRDSDRGAGRTEEEWGQHAQQLDRSADYFDYGQRNDAWRHQGDEERGRYHDGMSRMPGVSEMSGFPHTNYGNTARNEPYPPSRSNPNVWRGRNEDYDFWGRERHDQQQHASHPSLWQRVKGAFAGKGPKNYVRSDDRIHEDVCEHLTHHPYIDASDIEVIVRDGEVTLSGTVDARMVKRAAEEACDHVRGVKDVHNHLRVRPQSA